MANSQTIQPSSLDGNEQLDSNFFDDAIETQSALFEGHWFPIRFTPDLATGELFNVGVVFVTSNGDRHFKIIESARPFSCLYGNAGLENFTFLLQVLRQHLEKSETMISPSPHIIMGRPAYASGDNPVEILAKLFDSMVTLQCINPEAEASLPEPLSIGTEDLRKRLFKKIKAHHPGAFEKVYRRSPTLVKSNRGDVMSIDLPLWNDQHGLLTNKGPRFGTIVSAHYRDNVHRNYHLDSGSLGLLNAAMLLEGQNSSGSFLILQPSDTAEGYSEWLRMQIENDIDRATYALRKNREVEVVVSDREDVLMQSVLEMAN